MLRYKAAIILTMLQRQNISVVLPLLTHDLMRLVEIQTSLLSTNRKFWEQMKTAFDRH